jgi:hypothetical protein
LIQHPTLFDPALSKVVAYQMKVDRYILNCTAFSDSLVSFLNISLQAVSKQKGICSSDTAGAGHMLGL